MTDRIQSQLDLVMRFKSELPEAAAVWMRRVVSTTMLTCIRDYGFVLHPYDLIMQVQQIATMAAADTDARVSDEEREAANATLTALAPEVARLEAAGYDRRARIDSCLADYHADLGIDIEGLQLQREVWFAGMLKLWREHATAEAAAATA